MLIKGTNVNSEAEKMDKEDVVKWMVLSSPTTEEIRQIEADQHLPAICFTLAEERNLAFFKEIETHYGEPVCMLHIPLWLEESYEALKPADRTISLIYSNKTVLFLIQEENPAKVTEKLESGESPYAVMIELLLSVYRSIGKELDGILPRIDKVMADAKEKADRNVLLALTDLEQNVVVFSRRITDLEEAVSNWMEEKKFRKLTSSNKRLQLELEVKKSKYTSHLYQELIDSTSGLLSDSIDNKLNSIMEFLESVALVISIPTLIFSLFGMNTGGLAGRESPAGTLVVIAVSVILGAVVAIYLKRKEYL